MRTDTPSDIAPDADAPAERPESRGARRFRPWIVLLGIPLLAVCLIIPPVGTATAAATGKSGLPLPRFVSLRKDEVNLRTGPGIRYPIDWVLTYRNMPVEILAEFDAWRKVRDWKGTVGWVHKSMLSGRRWVIVRSKQWPLRRDHDAKAPVIAHLEQKVLGRLERCRNSWCRIDIAGLQGWIERSAIWGVYPDEEIR